jgi:Tn3 transposase DDE domain
MTETLIEAQWSSTGSASDAGEGRVRRRQPREQGDQAPCLNLLTDAVILWSTVYYQRAIPFSRKSLLNPPTLVLRAFGFDRARQRRQRWYRATRDGRSGP